MRKITKTHPPPEDLNKWCEDNQDANHSYGDLRGTCAHKSLKVNLLKEQGYLCAYTGQKINGDLSHIEHLKPQSQCGEWEDVDYRNLVACFPKNGGDISHGYGAPVKADWWDEQLFVSPLSDDCECRFRFTFHGKICPTTEGDEGAKTTIEELRLDNEKLRGLRESRIGAFFGWSHRTSTKPLSVEDANTMLKNIEQADANGQLTEFCFVLKQLLPRYINEANTP